MRELISALEDLELTLRNMQGHLRGESWPSKSLALMANDVIVWIGLTASSVETFRTALGAAPVATEEVKEIIKEEEGGEDIGEQVSEPEGGEVRPETAPQEPEARAPESRKRVRE